MQDNNITRLAEELLRNNICAVPCLMPSKRPALESWTKYQKVLPQPGEHTFSDSLGIITGSISGNIVVIDIDCKYDVSGTLLNRLEEAIGAEIWNRVFQSLYIQRTINNGVHIFFRCEQIGKNEKLARRYSIPDELKVNPDEKIKVLIETRAEGGFIVCAPTKGYKVIGGSLNEIGFISVDDKEALFTACRSLNEVFTEVKPPASNTFNKSLSGLPPWEDYNHRADVPALLSFHGWSYLKTVGENIHFTRPGKKGSTSGTYHSGLNLFRCFTTSSELDSDKSYSPAALFTFLECNGDFSASAKRLYDLGYGDRFQHTPQQALISNRIPEKKYFKDYILKEEPTEEIGIIYVNGVNVLSRGNVLIVFGPPKARKTRLAGFLVNNFKLRTAWIDSEQGRLHSWRTGQTIPTADVYHMRGEPYEEITRVINEVVACNEYELLVIDNVRDLIVDFNDVSEAGKMELFLKKISEQIPVIGILHENKNSKSPQGHLGHSLNKIAQTTIRVHLADAEDPGAGSIVSCVVSRDEPFKQCFFSSDGRLAADNLVKTNGKSLLLEDVLRAIGGKEYTRNEMNETFAEFFGITPKTAGNVVSQIRKAHPRAITERKEGKTKIFHISSTME